MGQDSGPGSASDWPSDHGTPLLWVSVLSLELKRSGRPITKDPGSPSHLADLTKSAAGEALWSGSKPVGLQMGPRENVAHPQGSTLTQEPAVTSQMAGTGLREERRD